MYPCFLSIYIFEEIHLITSRSLWIQGQTFAAIEKFGKGDLWFHRVCSSSLCAHGGLNSSKWLLTPFHISFLNLDIRCYTIHCKILCGIPTRIMSLHLLLMKHLRSYYESGNRCKEPCHGCLLQSMVGAMSALPNVVVRLWQGHQLAERPNWDWIILIFCELFCTGWGSYRLLWKFCRLWGF